MPSKHLIQSAACVQARHQIKLCFHDTGRLTSDMLGQKYLTAHIVGRLRRVIKCQYAYDAVRLLNDGHAQDLTPREILALTSRTIDHEGAILPLHPRD